MISLPHAGATCLHWCGAPTCTASCELDCERCHPDKQSWGAELWAKYTPAPWHEPPPKAAPADGPPQRRTPGRLPLLAWKYVTRSRK